MTKRTKRVTPLCPRCGRAVKHRTAKQAEKCIDTVKTNGSFAIDGRNDRMQVVFAVPSELSAEQWADLTRYL